ncbi:hypothetical protein ES706_00003 [subsurface metagenome]|nr:TIR domain-containing protein [Hadesarchaea archaeon]
MSRRVFISFQHDDNMQAKGFALLQWNPNVPVEFVGRHLLSPVDSEDEQYVRSKIREKLEGTSVTIVLIGAHTADSEWVDFEIRESLNRGNGVLGIRLPGHENTDVPPALKEAGAKIINWNQDIFPDEVERAALIVGRSELGPPPRRSVAPSSCTR